MIINLNFDSQLEITLSFHRTLAVMLYPDNPRKQDDYVFLSSLQASSEENKELRQWVIDNGGEDRLAACPFAKEFDSLACFYEDDWEVVYLVAVALIRAMQTDNIPAAQVTLDTAVNLISDLYYVGRGERIVRAAWNRWHQVVHLIFAFITEIKLAQGLVCNEVERIYMSYGDWLRRSYEVQKILKKIKKLNLEGEMYDFPDKVKDRFEQSIRGFELPPFNSREIELWRAHLPTVYKATKHKF